VNFADLLRSLIAPLTVKAIRAGADALDERTRLLATIAGLEATVADLARQLAELRPHPDPKEPPWH
jgi:hypothetical protein